MTTELPNWVYDLVMDLQHQEDVHPELLFLAGGMPAPAKYDWCPCAALAKVPAVVRVKASAIAAYRREAEKDKEPDAVTDKVDFRAGNPQGQLPG